MISVRFSKRSITVVVEPCDTVGSVKQKIEQLEGIPADEQRLMCEGRQLPDELKIINSSTLDLYRHNDTHKEIDIGENERQRISREFFVSMQASKVKEVWDDLGIDGSRTVSSFTKRVQGFNTQVSRILTELNLTLHLQSAVGRDFAVGGPYGSGYGGGGEGFGGGGRGGLNLNAGGSLRDIDWSRGNLKPIQKNFYAETEAVTKRDQYEIDQWIATNQVTLDGRGIPRPVWEFNEAPYPQSLMNLLYGKFQKPTCIQSISWPIAMSGRDIISSAKTGSGKTLAFMLPALIHTTKQGPRNRYDGPSVLVLLPTRELAQQVQEVSIDFCKALGLSMTCCFGGASKGPQACDLERGVDIIVATPGRLLDFMDNGTTNMKRCSYLVLDEADRMLDMGFEPQITKIIGQIRPDRQSLMFSATWPKEVRTMATDFLKDAAFVSIGILDIATCGGGGGGNR